MRAISEGTNRIHKGIELGLQGATSLDSEKARMSMFDPLSLNSNVYGLNFGAPMDLKSWRQGSSRYCRHVFTV